MHSTIARAQNVFGFFTTVAFAVAAFIALSDFVVPRAPSASVSVGRIQVLRGRQHAYAKRVEEFAQIRFDLTADFSSLFTWNTKQIFVWVAAEWPANATDGSAAQGTNEAVIWDSIITAPSADRLTNLGPTALKKLIRSAEGKSIDPSRGILKLKNQKQKYSISAPSGKLANVEGLTLRVHYNVQPWVGPLVWTQRVNRGLWKGIKGGVSKRFRLPAVKPKEEAKATS